MKKNILLLLVFTFLTCCKTSKETTSQKNDFNELFTLMQGSFTSEKHSQENKEYYNISMHLVAIWKDKGNYLYVEQALNENQLKPYRQRIYKVYQKDNNTFISEVYTLPNESDWVGKWTNPEAFDKLELTSISLKEGCEVVIRKENNVFKGRTGFKTCPSELKGASYATSEVTILPTQLISWDRGFDKDNNYIWGAKNGGYIFDRIE